MVEFRLGFLVFQRECDPQLKPVHAGTGEPQFLWSSFGMHDAASGGHPIDVTRPNRLVRSEAVAVNDLAVEEVRHGREADMRMRAHIDPVTRGEFGGPEVIEEHERANAKPHRRRQNTSDGKAAKVVRAGVDNGRDRRGLGASQAHRINRGQYAHALLPLLLSTARSLRAALLGSRRLPC